MKKPLVIFLGNRIFSDDRIGLEVGALLKDKLHSKGFDVEILESGGPILLDYLEGRESVAIVDSVKIEEACPGEVREISMEEFKKTSPASPHYMGLPEVLSMARQLGLTLPKKIVLIGIVVEDPYTVSEKLSDTLREKLGEIAEKVYERIVDAISSS